jgi:hypothetical protein
MNNGETTLAVFPPPNWIDKDSNRFGVECLDVRALTRNMKSMTDPDTERIFQELRKERGEGCSRICQDWSLDDWIEVTGMSYPPFPKFGIGPLFKAQVLEDKWDVYFLDGETIGNAGFDCLYFCRSWSGELVFRAVLEYDPTFYGVFGIQVNPEKKNFPTNRAQATVDYLIKSILLGLEVPAPLPFEAFSAGKALALAPIFPNGLQDLLKLDVLAPFEEIARIAFREYGWRAGFITPDDPSLLEFDYEHAEQLISPVG